ncbi:MAG TPA: efflux RND transporter periplasmic adaptor subunit [Thermoanaerobaculia bacterium]
MKLLTWMTIPALLLALAGCGGDTPAAGKMGGREGGGPGGPGGGGPSGPPREVRLATAEEGRLARTIDVSGTLAADEEAQLGFKIAGRIQQMAVDIGTPVGRGQVIARLVPTDYELRVTQARTALEQARARLGIPPQGPDAIVPPEETAVVRQAAATLKSAQLTRDRMARLFQEQLIPQADFDAAEAAYGVADGRYQEAVEEARTRQAVLSQRISELEIAKQQLADSFLRAPFDGVISERLSSVGDYTAAGAPVAVLVRRHPLRLRLAVPEREAAGVKPGLDVQLRAEGDPTPHHGQVARISPAISQDNRTLMVEAEVPNQGGQLRPGAFVQASIVVQAADPAVLVPASSLVTFAGIEKVITVEEGKAVEKRVRTGRRSGDQVEIVDGIKAGEPVVIQPGNIVTGEPLRVVP